MPTLRNREVQTVLMEHMHLVLVSLLTVPERLNEI